MRRTLLALPLVFGVLVFPSAASATHDLLGFESAVDAMHAVDPTLDPPPNDGNHDFVVGGFQTAQESTLGVSAHSDPVGDDVWGHVSDTGNDLGNEREKFRARVTCLAVAGNVAAYGSVVTHSRSNSFPPGTGLIDIVRDSGLPGGAGDGWQGFIVPSPDRCPQFLPSALNAPPIVRGNILVHDAQP